jgi:hypothetical protein
VTVDCRDAPGHQHPTAKAHVARLLAKLGVRDRVQLVIAAYQAAWSPRQATRREPRKNSPAEK